MFAPLLSIRVEQGLWRTFDDQQSSSGNKAGSHQVELGASEHLSFRGQMFPGSRRCRRLLVGWQAGEVTEHRHGTVDIGSLMPPEQRTRACTRPCQTVIAPRLRRLTLEEVQD